MGTRKTVAYIFQEPQKLKMQGHTLLQRNEYELFLLQITLITKMKQFWQLKASSQYSKQGHMCSIIKTDNALT